MNINITKFEEINNLKSCDSAVYTCYKCGKTDTVMKPKLLLRGRLICTSCMRSETQQLMLDPKAAEDRIRAKSTAHVSSIEEVKSIKGRHYVSFNCVKCGKLCGNDADRLLKKGLLLCGDCMKKHTNLEKFGFEYASQNAESRAKLSKFNREHKDEINEARRLSIQAHYGVDNVMQVEEHKQTCFDSNRANHGGILAQQTEEQRQLQSERMIANHGFSEQATATNIANHGGVHSLALPENREKLYEYQRTHKDEINEVRQETNMNKFGKINYMCYGEPEYIQNMIDKYLDDLPDSRKAELADMDFSDFSYILWNELPAFKKVVVDAIVENHELEVDEEVSYAKACALLRAKHPEWLEKTIKTFVERYHTTHPTAKPIYVDGMRFDSDWEVYVYLFYRDRGSVIIREPKPPLIYYDSEGIAHKYYPDFMIDGRYVEVKGTQFFKDQDPTKELISAYINPEWSQEKLAKEMDIARCKGECIKKNTFLISKHNIKPYKDYFLQNYDYNWLQSLYSRNLMRFAFSRFTFQPIYCNNMNNGKGVSPFDYDIKNDKYAPVSGKGISPFDIMK